MNLEMPDSRWNLKDVMDSELVRNLSGHLIELGWYICRVD